MLAEDSGGRTHNAFSSGSSAELGQHRLWGGGASGPGLRPRSQGFPKGCGVSGVLTKSGVGSELQDFLVLRGKEALRGARPLLATPPYPTIQTWWQGWEVPRVGVRLIAHLPRSGAPSGQRGHWVVGQSIAGPGTHINLLSQKLLQHLAAQQSQLHRGLEGKALHQPDWPTSAPRAGGLLREGQPRGQSHNMLG